ncbi:MAG: serine/threonine-protein phosphatase, partial [Oscillospiraceae bacterium]|nr:serine/threonine-protein phosphatase [Oscillospiraceae bacterium]
VRSGKEMNGSFYDFFFIDKNRFCIFIGEVGGKGIPAALLMVIAKTMIKNYAQLGYSAEKICMVTNRQLSANNESAGMNITAFIGILEIDSGLFMYVNAGHRLPMLKRSGGDFEYLDARGCFALGIMDNVPYWQQSVTLVQGDLLYFYNKGVIEAENNKGEQYSEDRMESYLNDSVTKVYDIKKIISDMKDEISEFTGGLEQNEDITMMILRYLGM